MSFSEFGQWLTAELEKQHKSQADLCREGNLDTGFVSKVLSGVRNPGMKFYRGVSKALGYSEEFLMRLTGDLPKLPGINMEVERAQYLITLLPENLLTVAIKFLSSLIPGESNDQQGEVGESKR